MSEPEYSATEFQNAPTENLEPNKSDSAKGKLFWVTLFLGELRDGLTMVSLPTRFLQVPSSMVLILI